MDKKSRRTESFEKKYSNKNNNANVLKCSYRAKEMSELKIGNQTKNTDDSKSYNKIGDFKTHNKIKEFNDTKNDSQAKYLADFKKSNKINMCDSKQFYNNRNAADSNNKIKDRGDLKVIVKPDIRMKTEEDLDCKIINPDGDKQNIFVNQRPENLKLNEAAKQLDARARNSEGLKALLNKRNLVRNAQVMATVDLKRVRERYTVKLRNPNRPAIPSKKDDSDKNDSVKKETKIGSIVNIKHKEDKELAPIKEQENSQVLPHVIQKTHDVPHVTQKKQDLLQVSPKGYDLANVAQKVTEKEAPNKKPVIKTIMTKNGSTRIYKAVAFEDRKVKPATLEIKIPNDLLKKPNSTKSIDVNSMKSKVTVSKVSVKEKKLLPRNSYRKCERKHRKHHPSRDRSVLRFNARSPPTEVAKWAPASVNNHTKPYYEAWVDTTLTAVSRGERLKDEKQSILQCLQKALERPETPELFYSNYADARYTGKIKITHAK